MKYNLFFIALLILNTSFGQSKIERFYQTKKYNEIINYHKTGKVLGGKDLYRVGQSYMMQKNDTAAIRLFNLATKKGFKTGDLYYDMAIAYNNIKFYQDGVDACGTALIYYPNRKPYLLEMGAALYQMNDLDSALSTYEYLRKLFPANQMSSFMVCQILHEQEKFKKCLKCYYTARGKFKDHNKFYRETYENIARLEWHHFKKYDKAESAIKNLMHAYPNSVEYNLWLLQLYHHLDRYDEGETILTGLQTKYDQRKLPNKYYDKGSILIDEYEINGFYTETYLNFQPEKKGGEKFSAFVFGGDSHKPLGKVSVKTTKEDYTINYSLYTSVQDFPESPSYENIKKSINFILINPPLSPESDTLQKN